VAPPAEVVEEAGWARVGSEGGVGEKPATGSSVEADLAAARSWASDPAAEALSEPGRMGRRRGQPTRVVRKGGVEGDERLVGGEWRRGRRRPWGGGGGRRWWGGVSGVGEKTEGWRGEETEEEDDCSTPTRVNREGIRYGAFVVGSTSGF
jgi:hypothetical protein